MFRLAGIAQAYKSACKGPDQNLWMKAADEEVHRLIERELNSGISSSSSTTHLPVHPNVELSNMAVNWVKKRVPLK
jgi:hypothetical protein